MNPAVLLIVTGLVAAGVKLIDAVKAATNKDANTLVTQIGTWAVGVGLVFVLAGSDFASKIELVQGYTLDAINPWSKVILGVLLISNGSLAFDFKKAFDNTDTAKQPAIMPSKNAVPPQA